MNKALLLIFFAPILPLVGSFWNHIAAMFFAGLAWAAILGGLMMEADASLRFLFLIQAPLMALLTVVAYREGRARSKKFTDDSAPLREELRHYQTLHQSLKYAVQKEEKLESQSFQIYALAKGLAGALSWKEMAPRLTTGIQKIFGGYEFLLFAYDENGGRTLLHRRGGWSQDFPLEEEPPDDAAFIKPPKTSEVVPVLSVPIHSGQGESRHRNGLLILKSPGGDNSIEEQILLGREFGDQLGMALDKALLFSQMEMHSKMDGLTGVLRRQAFMERLEEEFKRAGVFHTPFSLMMVDIDFFKSINDAHGHEAGDTVLKRVGALLKKAVYETDVIGRFGGEEFLVLLPKAQQDGALRKAEQLRRMIENDVILFGFEKIQITVSLGIAHYPNTATARESLIRRADEALYKAKENGRNQVVEAE